MIPSRGFTSRFVDFSLLSMHARNMCVLHLHHFSLLIHQSGFRTSCLVPGGVVFPCAIDELDCTNVLVSSVRSGDSQWAEILLGSTRSGHRFLQHATMDRDDTTQCFFSPSEHFDILNTLLVGIYPRGDSSIDETCL